MTIAERYKNWRRARIIKTLLGKGQQVPGETRIRTLPWRWPRTDWTLYNSELLFAAVSRLANAFASMPVQLYRRSVPVYNALNDLVSRAPNPNMTAFNWRRALEVCRCAGGNAYAMKVLDAQGEVVRLDVLDPSQVRPVMEEDSRELWYRIGLDDGREIFLHNWYVLHLPFLTSDGYTGINPVSVLYDTLSYSEDIQDFNRKQLNDGVNTSIVLEAPTQLGADQRQKTIDNFLNTYKETNGAILLLESGLTAKTMNLSPIDSKLFEVEKITRSKVAMVYNLPPHLLGDYGSTSYASQEQSMLEFLMLTMTAPVTAFEQELDRKLLTAAQRRSGLHFVVQMDAILRADAATTAEVEFKHVRSGVRTLDEVRAARNLPPYPGGIGKNPVVSRDLAPLPAILADPNAVQLPPGGGSG
jgi:HK97 family phage portal protein